MTQEPEKTRIIFDVGANDGRSTLRAAQKDPNLIVYAFEPTPEMVEVLKRKSDGLLNFKVYQKAVSDFCGRASFNVAGQADWGCSSLLEFSEKSKTEWPGRKDFKVTQTIDVEVIRLDTFMEDNGLNHIDHLHIDTQGSDLKVLIGLGSKIESVHSGVLEAATKKDILYKGQNTEEECVFFLEKNGFNIEKIKNNDRFGHEVNIFFSK